MAAVLGERMEISELIHEMDSEVQRIASRHLHPSHTMPAAELASALASNGIFSPKLTMVVCNVLARAGHVEQMSDSDRAFAMDMGCKALLILEAFD